MSNFEIKGYFADWCPHCKQFSPEWNKIKQWGSQNNIKVTEYRDGRDDREISKANIKGFPSLRLIHNNSVIKDLPIDSSESVINVVNQIVNKRGGSHSIKKQKVEVNILTPTKTKYFGRETDCVNGICKTRDLRPNKMKGGNNQLHTTIEPFDPSVDYGAKYAKYKQKYINLKGGYY